MDKKGVTLIELVVVMVIIAIGATLIAPSIGKWLPRYRLRSATRDIVSIMRTAQMRAVSYNRNYQVAFTPAGPGLGTYVLQRNPGAVNDGAIQTVPTGISFATNFPGNIVAFNPNSSATGGRVTVSNPQSERTITVSPSSARITAP
jgi:prepilin-type N-terminal cleavage/methylation domain-containing protein